MTDNTQNDIIPRNGYIAALLVMAAGIIVRFFRIGIDPPLFFTATGQDLLTDPYQYTSAARNAILFGDWNLFDYHRWEVFRNSLVSGFSYIVFLFFGVSRVTANLSAILLNLGGLMLFTAGMWKYSRRAALISGTLLFTNMTLLVYGRYPFLENGLIFICGLMFFLFIRYYPRTWVLIVSGVLVALSALSGKMFGVVMIAPPALVIWSDDRRSFVRRFGIVLGSAFLSALLFILILYGKDFGRVYDYLSEQTVGMYGAPIAFTSPIKFIEWVMTFAGQSRLFHFAPFLLLLFFATAAKLVFRPKISAEILKSDRMLAFNIGWLAAGCLLLMLFNYRPLRYQLFLLPPLSGIISAVLLTPGKGAEKKKPGLWHILIFFLVCWYFCTQTVFAASLNPEAPYKTVWYVLAPAAVLTGVLYWLRKAFMKVMQQKQIILTVLIVLYVLSQSYLIFNWFDKGTYDLKRTGEDLAQIVNPEAVIIGPYAQALTIDNKLKSFIYMFGLARKEPALLQQFPITHLALDVTNWGAAVTDYPQSKNVLEVGRYWVRDIGIRVLKLDDLILKKYGRAYRPSDFEIGAYYYARNQLDSVGIYLNRFLTVYPHSKSGLSTLAGAYFRAARFKEGLAICDRLLEYYPDDFALWFDKAVYCYKLYRTNHDAAMLAESERLFNRALDLNPYLGEDIALAKKQADEATR